MRQAGRYLPEYREVRAKAGSFLDLCYTPALAAEVTLQPIRRYGFDAAILFSDILVVPDALGQKRSISSKARDRGSSPFAASADLARLSPSATRPKFARVFETVARLRQDLPQRDGADRLLRRAVDGGDLHGGRAGLEPTRREARLWAYRDRAGFRRLIDLLVETSIDYLSGQVEAGADVLQIFDTLGRQPCRRRVRALGGARRRRAWCARCKQKHPDVPIIGFPAARRHGQGYVPKPASTGWAATPACRRLHGGRAVAGTARGAGQSRPAAAGRRREALDERVRSCERCRKPFIFNLGHGIVPDAAGERGGWSIWCQAE